MEGPLGTRSDNREFFFPPFAVPLPHTWQQHSIHLTTTFCITHFMLCALLPTCTYNPHYLASRAPLYLYLLHYFPVCPLYLTTFCLPCSGKTYHTLPCHAHIACHCMLNFCTYFHFLPYTPHPLPFTHCHVCLYLHYLCALVARALALWRWQHAFHLYTLLYARLYLFCTALPYTMYLLHLTYFIYIVLPLAHTLPVRFVTFCILHLFLSLYYYHLPPHYIIKALCTLYIIHVWIRDLVYGIYRFAYYIFSHS